MSHRRIARKLAHMAGSAIDDALTRFWPDDPVTAAHFANADALAAAEAAVEVHEPTVHEPTESPLAAWERELREAWLSSRYTPAEDTRSIADDVTATVTVVLRAHGVAQPRRVAQDITRELVAHFDIQWQPR
jgi:hypothetical protein